MTRDEWSAYLVQSMDGHLRGYTEDPGRRSKFRELEGLFGSGHWPSGWNITKTEMEIMFGVFRDTMLDILEQLGQLTPSQPAN